MHIYEGVLASTANGQVLLLGGAALAAAGTAIGLRRLDYEQVPRVAVLSSAFFVTSLVHVPLGPTSEHLVLSGLMGLVLGWAAVPAILVALLLQAIFFSFGGLNVLGVNTVVMAVPAVVCHYLFRGAVCSPREPLAFAGGFAAGAFAILLGALLCGAVLIAASPSFAAIGKLLPLGHLPIAGVEGLVTGSVVVLVRKVRPELLSAPLLVSAPQEVADA